MITENKINVDVKSNYTEQIRHKSTNFNSNLLRDSDINKQLMLWHNMQNELVNIASHEMKTPIQSILAYSELLLYKPYEVTTEYVEAIYRNALRLQKLSNNLLDITRIENHAFTLKNEIFDLNELISRTIQEFTRQIQVGVIENKDVTFLFSTKDSLYVWADKDRISQVISNLIDNALKFTQEGSITIETKSHDNMAMISVRDSGVGISSQIAPKLFSKFSTSEYNGTGLGLYISKAIIEKHGGRIWAENGIHKGATFLFEIPCITDLDLTHSRKHTVYF